MVDSRDLVTRASQGSSAAVESLLVAHLPDLQAYVRLKAGPLVRAKETPEDVVQSVCREVLRELEGFDYRGEAAFRNWLFKRAYHKIIKKRRYYRADKRDAARERPLPDASHASVLACYRSICTPSKIASDREVMQQFEEAFNELNEDYREAITLHDLVGLGYPEIAVEMDRSIEAVRNLVWRGKAKLAMLLDPPE